MGVTVAVGMVVAFAAGCDAEGLVHCDEGEEADHYAESEEEVPVRLDHDEADVVGAVFAEEDLR